MIFYLIAGALLAALVFSLPGMKPKDAKAQEALKFWGLFGLLTVVAVFLAMRGMFAALVVPVVFPLLRGMLFKRLGKTADQTGTAQDGNTASSATSMPLSRTEALDILGLADPVEPADIDAAYKKLMGQVHPDKGGNDWLAGRLNAARDRLINGR